MAACVPAARSAEPLPGVKLEVAGNDQVLWLAVGQFDTAEAAYFYRFATLDKTATQLRSVMKIEPQKGTIGHLAVVGRELHVFFGQDAHFREDGAHYRYDQTGGDRALSLPGPTMPAAVAGESSGDRPRLWAVVSAGTAAAVRAEWERQRQGRASQPAEPAASAPENGVTIASSEALWTSGPSLASETYHLVQYDGARWSPGFVGPRECSRGKRFWLAVGENRFHLFWQDQTIDREVRYAWREADQWMPGTSLQLDAPPGKAFAGVINARVIFASPTPGADSLLRIAAWVWQPGSSSSAGAWSRLPGLEESAGQELTLPADAVMGGFADKLVVTRAGERSPEVAFFSPATGGPPDKPFEEIPLAGAGMSKTQRHLRDLLATLVVASLLLLVFWRRQESIAAPIPLPAGVVVAGPGKRAAAALIDMIPAALIANAIWFESIRRFVLESQAAFAAGQSEQIEIPDGVVWAWLFFILVYTAWGIVFEILWQATPGKRLMRCQVRREDFDRPNVAQVVIRNLSKIIELMPYLQIWPFMLVVFFTRNHQRMGDLLARTLVVEQQHIVAGSGEDFGDGQNPD
jgi:uncharacterized RDD family membrane protein YckC